MILVITQTPTSKTFSFTPVPRNVDALTLLQEFKIQFENDSRDLRPVGIYYKETFYLCNDYSEQLIIPESLKTKLDWVLDLEVNDVKWEVDFFVASDSKIPETKKGYIVMYIEGFKALRMKELKYLYESFYPYDFYREDDKFIIYGYSPFFDSLKPNEQIPQYELVFSTNADGKSFLTKAQKVIKDE